MPHPELASEQAYVDNAYACLDKMRTTLEGSQDRMATEFAAVAMEAWLTRRRKTFDDAERGLVFGRLRLDGTPRPLYIGRRWVHDDAHEALVVNWQAPAARPFYTATPTDPQRVTQRRRFRTEQRRIVDISDEALDGSVVEGASVSDFLLEELDRRREGRMRDIVATIQSDQYRLITAEPDGALVVQGGPGTGKTAVGLHRASWLLYTHREQLRRVLVVGPNPTFMDYVSHVLPALGEDAVEQRAVSELLDGIEVSGEDAPDVARLKADPRLAEVVQRAVEQTVSVAPEDLVLYADGAFVSVKERDVAALLDDALGAGLALGPARDRPKRAAELRWSAHDPPLLDVARTLVDGPPRTFGHVIVDEAQDLSPMQLLAVSRRAVDGSLTILGDVAQATGPVVYGRWQELEGYLPEDAEMSIEELRHAYRVPAEIMELALPLLERIAPDVEAPIAYRQGGALPRLVR